MITWSHNNAEMGKELRVNPRAIRVQDMRRKWGSCFLAGTVPLSNDLVDQNQCIQGFAITHELLHLRVPTHGRVLKALVSVHISGWRDLEERHITLQKSRRERA